MKKESVVKIYVVVSFIRILCNLPSSDRLDRVLVNVEEIEGSSLVCLQLNNPAKNDTRVRMN